MEKKLFDKLAQYEVGWWIAHHRKDERALKENMARLYELQFNIPYYRAVEAVQLRVQATKEHDLAEKFEDEGNQSKADEHWKRAEDLLRTHFRILYDNNSQKI